MALRYAANINYSGRQKNPATKRLAKCWVIRIFPVVDDRFQPAICERETFAPTHEERFAEAQRLRELAADSQPAA